MPTPMPACPWECCGEAGPCAPPCALGSVSPVCVLGVLGHCGNYCICSSCLSAGNFFLRASRVGGTGRVMAWLSHAALTAPVPVMPGIPQTQRLFPLLFQVPRALLG